LSPARRDERPHGLEPVLGRSLAETQRLNDPGQHAAREARAIVRRRVAEGRQVPVGRRIGLAMAALFGLLGALAALLWLLEG
jgi:hypothetical protein